jgi:hypothetical protein
MVAEVTRRIAPFELAEARNGFEKESASNSGAANMPKITGTPMMGTRDMSRPLPTGGYKAVEVVFREGKLDTIGFKTVDKPGMVAMWDAKPILILSGPVLSESSNGIGFNKVTLIDGGTDSEYSLIGPNTWSLKTRADQ